jgi:hypothetical protein
MNGRVGRRSSKASLNGIIAWNPVTTSIDGDPINTLGYEVIVENDPWPSSFSALLRHSWAASRVSMSAALRCVHEAKNDIRSSGSAADAGGTIT